MRTTLRNLLVAAAVAGLSACVPLAPPGGLFVAARFGPPAPRVEVIGVAPGPGYVWIRGFYRWGGGAYYWVPGRWAYPPYPRAVWVPGRWARARDGWYWTEGRWAAHGRGRGHRERD